MSTEMLKIGDVELELFQAGDGAPLLFLHGAYGFEPGDPYVAPLAARHRVVVPSHPGFGRSGLPDWLDSVADIAHLHLELASRLGFERFDVVGCSLGGWIAADMAVKSPERIRRMVLVGPVGVKLGPPDRLDIPDIFALPQDAVARLLYHDPAQARDPAALSDDQLAVVFRNRETLALLAWEPFFHDPKLRHLLFRVTAPTLLIRGASDGLVSRAYLDGYARLIRDARTVEIAAAGHAPQIEQPQAFASAVLSFLDAATTDQSTGS